MWIRPNRTLQARMPSMRPQPSQPAPGSVPDMQRRRIRVPEPSDPPTEDEELFGSFHESSYELRRGMDMFEIDWPDAPTKPGSLTDR